MNQKKALQGSCRWSPEKPLSSIHLHAVGSHFLSALQKILEKLQMQSYTGNIQKLKKQSKLLRNMRSEFSPLLWVTEIYIYMGSVTRKMSTNKHWVEGQVQAMLAWSTHCARGWCQGCEHGLMAVAKETVLEMGLEFLSEGWLQRWFVLQKHTRLILTKAAIAQQLIQPLVWYY